MKNNNYYITAEEEKEVVDFLVFLIAILIRIEEGKLPPQPANDNYPET